MSLPEKIKAIYPSIDFINDCIIQDDGNGAYIKSWNYQHPQPTQSEIDSAVSVPTKADFIAAVQVHIDATAQSKGYDSAISCASYATDTHPPFAAEAAVFIPWRSNVWLYCYSEWAKVEAGQRQVTTAAAFINELPVIVWP